MREDYDKCVVIAESEKVQIDIKYGLNVFFGAGQLNSFFYEEFVFYSIDVQSNKNAWFFMALHTGVEYMLLIRRG